MRHCFTRLTRRGLLLTFVAFCAQAQPRPLTHSDYADWKNIQNQQLSPDGKFLAYALFPQEGDGQFVVRELSSNKELRHPIGARPAPPRPDPAAAEDAPPLVPAITVNFSSDSRTVVFSTFPTKADVDRARNAKPKPAEAPKNGMVILDLTTGQSTRVDNVKNFQVPDAGAGYIAWLTAPSAAAPAAAPVPAPLETTGTLVLHKLSDASERTFPDVTEYTLKKDARTLVYAVASKNSAANGVYALRTDSATAPAALLSGPGKYAKLTWDEAQSRLAFLTSHQETAPVVFTIYSWTTGPGARETVSPQTPGFRTGFSISDQGGLAFSKDGRHLFFGSTPSKPAAPKTTALAEDLPSFDLWHYKDDYIQPMQKVRAQTERNRTFRAVYHVGDKTVVQLGDLTMADITPTDDGLRAFGFDDRPYRAMQEYDERYADTWLINTVSGERRMISQKAGRPTLSPDGRYALLFNGKDWTAFALADGKPTNLTAALSAKFWQEEHDSPSRAPAWGTAGFTKDGQYALLYDHYDVWAVKPDGTGARNLTRGEGRKQQLIFRCVNLNPDPKERGLDSTQPLLLRAENAATHDTGFYRINFDAGTAPIKLLMAAKEFSVPVKARNADVLMLAESAFEEFPDLRVTNAKFENVRRVTDANPQKSALLWGSAELFHYRNVDGVKLDGALYKPANFDPKKKYPMLVYIYERLAQNVHHFVPPAPGHNINISYYTSNGYIVITPDIAYTIGYPGQSAQKCVLAAVEEIVQRGFVDENAIGIQGHSWGGYQIAYMITRTNRFRAAAAGAPVADMISAYDGVRWGPGIPRQFQYERTQSRIGGSIWEYPLRFIENSPIFMADRVNTPLMMIHNDADDAVPWYQGIEYYLALRRLGKEVYLFTYNGEPHGLRRRPNQKDYTLRLQQYFDYYLKGAPKPEWMERGIPFTEKTALTP